MATPQTITDDVTAMPFTLSAPCELLEVISKSRFLAKAAPVQSPEEAQAFVQAVSDPTATHSCWAWKIGNQYRFSDAAEPGGTADRPILTAIQGQEFARLAVGVSRWSAGPKRGPGALVSDRRVVWKERGRAGKYG